MTRKLASPNISPIKRAQRLLGSELETCMKPFLITVRTATVCITFSALAVSSTAAAILTAEVLGDQIYGITVVAGVR